MQLIAFDYSQADVVFASLFEYGAKTRNLLEQRVFKSDTPEQIDTEIKEWVEENSLFGTNCIAIIPARWISTRRLSLPFQDRRRIEQTLPFELDGSIPFPLEDVTYNWHVIHTNEQGGVDVHVTFVANAKIEGLLQRLASCHLDPRTVLSPEATLTRIPISQAEDQATEFTLTIYSDLQRTHALFRDAQGIICGQKSFYGDTATISASILASLQSQPTQFQPKRLIFCGEDTAARELQAALERATELPCSMVRMQDDIFDFLHSTAIEQTSVISILAGLAAMDHRRTIPTDLRTGKFVFAGDMTQYKSDLRKLALGAAGVLTLAIIALFAQWWSMSVQEKRLDRAFCQLSQEVFKERICDSKRVLQRLRDPSSQSGFKISDYGADHILEMVSRAVRPETDAHFSRFELKLTADGALVTGDASASDHGAVQQLKTELEALNCVRKAETGNQVGKKDKVEYSLKLDVQCPDGVLPTAGLSPPADQGLPAHTDPKDSVQDSDKKSTTEVEKEERRSESARSIRTPRLPATQRLLEKRRFSNWKSSSKTKRPNQTDSQSSTSSSATSPKNTQNEAQP